MEIDNEVSVTVTTDFMIEDENMNDEEWTIINKEINSPRALVRLYEEQMRKNCASPETDNDEGCMSPCSAQEIQGEDERERDSNEELFRQIRKNQALDEENDELAFLRMENSELRLVVAQLRSYISTLQKVKKTPALTGGTGGGDVTPDATRMRSSSSEPDIDSVHSLRNDLLRLFSTRKRTKFD